MHEPLRQRHKEGDATRLNAYADVETSPEDDHAAYFFRRDHFHELDFLLNSARKIRIGELLRPFGHKYRG